MLAYVLVLVACLWLRRLWVTRYLHKLSSKGLSASSSSECEADLLESGLSVELRGRKRVHMTSEATPPPQYSSSVAFPADNTFRFPDPAVSVACYQPVLKSVSARPMSPTQLLTVTKALQMELHLTASNRSKQVPQHRKSVRPFIGSVAARRAKSREYFTCAETEYWIPPLLISESPLFPASKISERSTSIRARPKRVQKRMQDCFSTHLVNEIDSEDDAWAKSGRNPAADPRWWTVGVVRAVSRKDLADYFNQQDVKQPLFFVYVKTCSFVQFQSDEMFNRKFKTCSLTKCGSNLPSTTMMDFEV